MTQSTNYGSQQQFALQSFNANEQTKLNESQGLVWQPYAMGGGQWIVPQVVRLSATDIERIAAAVVRKLQEQKDD